MLEISKNDDDDNNNDTNYFPPSIVCPNVIIETVNHHRFFQAHFLMQTHTFRISGYH